MRPKIKEIVLEPKKFFTDLWQVISWPKVIGFLLVVVFFVNMGIFIYEKKNPNELETVAIDKVESPFTEEDATAVSPNELFGIPRLDSPGDSLDAMPNAENVLNQKTKPTGDNLPPIARAKILTTSYTEGIFAGDTVFLSASESYDPDGRIDEIRWDFDQQNGLGIDASGSSATVKYHNPGVYTATLTVIDERGKEGTTSLSITVAKKPEEIHSSVVQGLTTNKIDFDSLNFTSRMEIQNALESSYANFQSESYTMFAQAIYNSQNKQLPALPSLSDIELDVNGEDSARRPVVDSVIPSEGDETTIRNPIISAGFYGYNEIDLDGIEMTLNGVSVTPEIVKSKFGVQYNPTEPLSYGKHQVMLVIPDQLGLRTVKTWSFTVVDPTGENSDLVKEYVDEQGPQIILHYPDQNAKEVKPSSDIRISYDEPVIPESVEVAVVDLSTNITKFFTKDQIEFNATNTGFIIRPNESVFDYDRAYQIVVRQQDKEENYSVFDWYILGENYNEPEFEITSPENNSSTNQPQVTVTGFADPTYTITVDGKVATVDQNGAFKVDISLERGKNELLVVAKDLKGKQSSQYLILTYDPNANGGNPILDTQESPVIMDASLKDNVVITKVRPQISFVYADTDGIDNSSIRLLVDGEDVTKYSFIAKDTITYQPLDALPQGEHTVQLIVADMEGNTTDYEMTFIIDAYPDKPTNLNASLTNNNESVLLIWDGVDNIENPEYRVYRSTLPNVDITAGNEVKRGLTGTTWQDNHVIDGTTYFYRVAAVNGENIGNPSNEVEIRVDSTPPKLHIMAPEKNAVTDKDNVTIKGVTEVDATVEVFVNFVSQGEPEIGTDGTFEMNVPLIPEENILTIVSKDADGNESVDVRTITYKVPDIDSPYPDDYDPKGSRVKVESDIVIEYNEPINPDTFKMILKKKGEREAVIPITIADVALLISDDKTTVTYQVPGELEYEQDYVVEIYVEDESGNVSYDDDWEFRTEDKDPPIIDVYTPEENAYIEETFVSVTGKTEPNVDIKIQVSTDGGEYLDPVEFKSQADGYFNKLIELIPYKENVITIQVTDHLGHTSEKVIEVVCSPPDREKPLLLINSPDQNAIFGDDRVKVEGIIEPEARITILVNGEVQFDEVNNDSDFSKNIRLNSGYNLLKFIATDESGNQTIVTRTVEYDNVAPLMEIANPIDGYTTNQKRVELRGITDREGVEIYVNINSKNNPVRIIPNDDGSFRYNIELEEDNNEIIVTARDLLGNEIKRTIDVYYDPVGDTYQSQDETGVSGNGVNGQGSNDGSDVNGQGTNDVVDQWSGEKQYTGGDGQAPSDISFEDISFEDNKNAKDGMVTSIKEFTFKGETEPEADINIYQNGIIIYDGKSSLGKGEFAVDTELVEGKNIFTVDSTDASGNRRSETLVVTLDSKGPSLNVLSPKVDTVTNQSKIVVYGVTEPDTEVVVELGNNREKVTSDEAGYFTTKINTGPRPNKPDDKDYNIDIVVTATDDRKNTTVKTIPIRVDRLEPDLKVNRINDEPIPSDKVEDSPYGKTIHVGTTNATISGKTEEGATVEVYSQSRLIGSTVSANGDYFVDVGMRNGEEPNRIEVRATDEAGNTASRYFKVVSDFEPPNVFMYEPVVYYTGPTNARVQNVDIEAEISDHSEPYDVVIRVNGKKEHSENDQTTDRYKHTLKNELSSGENIIILEITDDVGNQTRMGKAVVIYGIGSFTDELKRTSFDDTPYTPEYQDMVTIGRDQLGTAAMQEAWGLGESAMNQNMAYYGKYGMFGSNSLDLVKMPERPTEAPNMPQKMANGYYNTAWGSNQAEIMHLSMKCGTIAGTGTCIDRPNNAFSVSGALEGILDFVSGWF